MVHGNLAFGRKIKFIVATFFGSREKIIAAFRLGLWARGNHLIDRRLGEGGFRFNGEAFTLAGLQFYATATGRQRPEQKQWQAAIEAAGGCYILARSVDDALEGLRRLAEEGDDE